jgi:surfactin family lipopeptide synthetase C
MEIYASELPSPITSPLNFVSIPELFYAQAAYHPTAPAFLRGHETITFRQLADRANQIAALLQGMKIGVGDVVGVSLERSFEMVAALIAILQTGAAFLPLDPGYPQERLVYMQQDAGVQAIIATHTTLENLAGTTTESILLDKVPARKKVRPCRCAPISPDAPAYLIYTSGSTGKPKGVVLPHLQIVNRFQWMWQAYPFTPEEVGCQRTALNFVDSIWEIFGYLLQGIPTAIIPDEIVKDPFAFVDELARCKVSRLWLVPSLLRVLLDSIPNLAEKLPDLKFWVTTGETIPGELFKRFQEEMPHATVYNLYGTSEVWDVTWYTPEEAHAHLTKIPIGKPITNYTAYILDDDLHPVPMGAPGMLYVGGMGLGYGYLNRPALTAERFIPNPFAVSGPDEQPPSPHDLRLYKTGDLACWLPDGNIEFLGRADFQIKIRGHRVELGEVEIALREHPEVKNVVVVDKDTTDGEKKLVAYLVMREDSEVSVIGLRKFLREKLPDHMVPAYYEFLDQLP